MKHFVPGIFLSLLFSTCHAQNAVADNSQTPELLWQQQTTSHASVSHGIIFDVSAQKLAELFSDKTRAVQLNIPLPDGSSARYQLTPSPVLAPALSARYPQLMAYQGVEVGNPANSGRFDISDKGLSGLFVHNGEWVFLSAKDEHHLVYYRDQAVPVEHSFSRISDAIAPQARLLRRQEAPTVAEKASGDRVKTYRLAISTTFAYTNYHGGLEGAMTALNTLVNRINQILLTDFAIQFELVANNDLLINTTAEDDPFSNENPGDDIETNQSVIDELIGADNYDIGHVLASPINGGGLAFVGVICDPPIFGGGLKAQGYSGSVVPDGERFHVDLVLHELGHQLGATHTFNALGQGACQVDQFEDESSVEPGSGSTIMSYAGICGTGLTSQNIQSTASPFFHSTSIRQIREVLDDTSIASCGTFTGETNQIPQITLARNTHTIPALTPFVLTADTFDADGDPLSHSWEQSDGSSTAAATMTREELNSDNGENPLFRVFNPIDSSTRYFPRFSSVLSGELTNGEVYPATNRQLNFDLIVRDQRGGVNTAEVELTVVDTGEAFSLISPDASSQWTGGLTETIRWNTAQTQNAPINCERVSLALDLDGDDQFEEIANDIANTGNATIIAPNTESDRVRLKIQCQDNVFYAVTPDTFAIVPGGDPVAPVITGQSAISIAEDSEYTLTLDDLVVNDPDTPFPDGFTLSVLSGDNYSVSGTTVSPDANFSGDLAVEVVVNDGIADSAAFPLSITVTPVNDPPRALDDSLTVTVGSSATLVDVVANDTDPDNDPLTITLLEYTGSGQVSISDNQLSYTPATSFSGSETVTYTIDDGTGLTDQAVLRITVNPPTSSVPPTTGGGSSGGGGGAPYWLLALIGLGVLRKFCQKGAL